MSRVNLPVLMMKLTCDPNPDHRTTIVSDHVRVLYYGDVEHCFWDLVAACPDQIDVFQKYSGTPKPGVHRIKKLMVLYYAHFKKSVHFDKKFLDYDCVGEVDPLSKVEDFCTSPNKKGLEAMTQMYKFIDVRVERVIRKCVPPEYFVGCFNGSAAEATFPYLNYDDRMIPVKQTRLTQEVTQWQGKILLQISMGKTRALAWEGFNERARTFRTTTNADVRGVCNRITAFVEPMMPVKPIGWYSFFLPKSFCDSNYANLVELTRLRDEHKRARKTVRRIKTEDDVLREADEIKRRRGMAPFDAK